MIYELAPVVVLIVAAGLGVQGGDAPTAVIRIVLSFIDKPRTMARQHGCVRGSQGFHSRACRLLGRSSDRAVALLSC